ncbi:MAG: SPASM domain-containing protein [Proteobacteria bacterium]|nr:SPASM domain-containing protein [Pseudomonadota bacterium]
MPTLEFTLMVGCPLMCSFCPQDRLRQSYGKATKYFSLETFRTILAKVPEHVRIDFSGMAEPWANREATAMLRHTLEAGYSMAIYTTLYGMSAADAEAIVDLLRAHAAQVEILCLHLPDHGGNMRGWRYDQVYADNVRAFMDVGRSGVLRRFEAMTMDGSGRLHPDLAALGLHTGAWVGHSRAGNVTPQAVPDQPLLPAQEKHGAVTCGYTPFYDQNVCLPNGDVVLCCMDYGLQHRIGNLLEQDYYEIFAAGGVARVVSENMKPHFSAGSLCKRCDRAVVHTPAATRQFWQPVA